MQIDNAFVIRIKNFMGIENVALDAKGINVIHGQNNQSKTSILKSLSVLFNGSTDPNLVKIGAEKAELMLEIPNYGTEGQSLSILRRITNEGRSTLDVKIGKDKVKSPQAFLDGMSELVQFNPVSLLDPKKRNDYIMSTIDVRIAADDIAKYINWPVGDLPPFRYDQHALLVLDQAHMHFYNIRALANKDTQEKKKRWEVFKDELPKEKPEAPPSREELAAAVESLDLKIDMVKDQIKSIEELEKSRAELIDQKSIYEKHVQSFESEVALMKANQAPAESAHKSALAELEAEYNSKVQAEILRFEKAKNDAAAGIAQLEGRIQSGHEHIAVVTEKINASIPDKAEPTQRWSDLLQERANCESKTKDIATYEAIMQSFNRVDSLEIEYKAAEEHAAQLTKRVDALAGPIQKDLMATIEMPVPGLEYHNGAFYIDGVKVDNLSTSRTIRLAMMIAKKLAGPLKMILVDGAEALDPETREEFFNELKDDGFIYFFSIVGDGVPLDFVQNVEMHQGAIVGQNQPVEVQP